MAWARTAEVVVPSPATSFVLLQTSRTSWAPVFSTGDLRLILALFAACLLGAFATHRLARLIPPVRRATADWESWTRKDFPMGLALAGTLIFYLFAPILAQ